MFSSFFRDSRSKQRRRRHARADSSPFESISRDYESPSGTGNRPLSNDRGGEDDGTRSEGRSDENGAGNNDEDEAGSSEEDTPLLPIFDSSSLDKLPVYVLTHTVRLMVSERCETVLSWEQLRSPQVSQFLLKPIQQEIRANHFSAATIYVLMANCLQFNKETASNPGNSGTSKTRAMICELLAIKTLREYSTRELIDALSYDFDPLQGQVEANTAAINHLQAQAHGFHRGPLRSARISCLEIAIRAQAKRFLAHPFVVQQLQAIWDGSIVFYNAADSLHRKSNTSKQPDYGTISSGTATREDKSAAHIVRSRRVVTIYNPRDASFFKLSRLRVPRYRNMLSTLSLAILLGLFVAVLVERSLEITPLEVIFWFWTAGYMLDEVVTFTEQGFGLYIASFWNTFDLGILLLLVVHFCLRLYGLVIPTAHKHSTANTAYDILAASAILLFPRLFSVLDHYRYFSQLIIAFRMMASDLMAVFILILIACSGFFVALSLSFGQDSPDDPRSIGFALLQLLLGFTPAAWDRWGLYTPLGRFILVFYMFITHFVVVTILISVLTNSFMAVVQNANEEHQFLFAVNTISSVKSDSLFSYIPPLNVLQWLMTPTRYFVPLWRYVQWNRTLIKITHLPILLGIYIYERIVLQSSLVDRIDLIENKKTRKTFAQRLPRLLREPSVVNFRQDQALEEVFKQPFDETIRTAFARNQRKSSNVVNKWMNDMGEGTASPPEEQDPIVLHKLERRRPFRRQISAYSRSRNISRRAMSTVSDPADVTSHADFFSPSPRITPVVGPMVIQNDDADGDDELLTNDLDEDENDRFTIGHSGRQSDIAGQPGLSSDKVHPRSFRNGRQNSGTNVTAESVNILIRPPDTNVASEPQSSQRAYGHVRNTSSGTILFNPIQNPETEAIISRSLHNEVTQQASVISSGAVTPALQQASDSTGRRTAKKKSAREIRPAILYRNNPAFRSTPNIQGLAPFARPQHGGRRSSLEMDIVSDIGDNKALGGGYVGAIPASFATQVAYAAGGVRQLQKERQDEQERMSRLMMARMNSLEEGFRDVIHEMRETMKPQSGTASRRRSRSGERSPRLQSRKERESLKGKERLTRSGINSGGTSVSNDTSSRPLTAVPDYNQSGFSVHTQLDGTANVRKQSILSLQSKPEDDAADGKEDKDDGT